MKQRLVEVLVCPVSGGKLSLEVTYSRGDEIISGVLTSALGQSYPIAAGVPRMLAADQIIDDQRETANAFSEKWRTNPNYGHDEASRKHYIDWYLQRYLFGTTTEFRKFISRKHRILDAGTGLGRDALFYADNSDAEVFGVDLSDAIDGAYKHLSGHPRIHLVQADLCQLPFSPEFFDFIACDQVLHHTPDTEQSFHKLVKQLAPGGDISIYVYNRKAPLREYADGFLRDRAAHMTTKAVWELSEQLTELGRSLSQFKLQISVPEIPALEVKAGTYDLQRFIFYNFLKCYWNSDLGWEVSVATNFDWYRPHFAHRHTVQEVRQWYADAGLMIVSVDECESGISVRGCKAPSERVAA